MRRPQRLSRHPSPPPPQPPHFPPPSACPATPAPISVSRGPNPSTQPPPPFPPPQPLLPSLSAGTPPAAPAAVCCAGPAAVGRRHTRRLHYRRPRHRYRPRHRQSTTLPQRTAPPLPSLALPPDAAPVILASAHVSPVQTSAASPSPVRCRCQRAEPSQQQAPPFPPSCRRRCRRAVFPTSVPTVAPVTSPAAPVLSLPARRGTRAVSTSACGTSAHRSCH